MEGWNFIVADDEDEDEEGIAGEGRLKEKGERRKEEGGSGRGWLLEPQLVLNLG